MLLKLGPALRFKRLLPATTRRTGDIGGDFGVSRGLAGDMGGCEKQRGIIRSERHAAATRRWNAVLLLYQQQQQHRQLRTCTNGHCIQDKSAT